jgi:hypothetical protein
MDNPCAMVSFYSELSANQLPSLAIAGGSHIYIYRNLIPYHKYTLPSISLDQIETDIWRALRLNEADPASAVVRTCACERDVIRSCVQHKFISLNSNNSNTHINTRTQVILRDAMDNGVGLSARSLNLLSLKSSNAQKKFIESVKHEPVQQLTTTTCLGASELGVCVYVRVSICVCLPLSLIQ